MTEALIDTAFDHPSVRDRPMIWEPASGDGAIAKVFRKCGFDVIETDIAGRSVDCSSPLMGDFLARMRPPEGVRAIVTNPPYRLAQQFIEHAIDLMRPVDGLVAMLLRIDFDSAATRKHLFRDCDEWWMKLVLTRRIRWFEGANSPSENHAWYAWKCGRYRGNATITYAP